MIIINLNFFWVLTDKEQLSMTSDETVQCVHSSHRRSLSCYYWHETRDGRTFLTQSRWGNNSLCSVATHNMRSLRETDSLTTHGRTLKASYGSGIQLSYLVWNGWRWLTRANNYQQWKLDPFLQARKKSLNIVGKKIRIAE